MAFELAPLGALIYFLGFVLVIAFLYIFGVQIAAIIMLFLKILALPFLIAGGKGKQGFRNIFHEGRKAADFKSIKRRF